MNVKYKRKTTNKGMKYKIGKAKQEKIKKQLDNGTASYYIRKKYGGSFYIREYNKKGTKKISDSFIFQKRKPKINPYGVLTLNQAINYVNYKLSRPVLIKETGFDKFVSMYNEVKTTIAKSTPWTLIHMRPIEEHFETIFRTALTKNTTNLPWVQDFLGADYERLINWVKITYEQDDWIDKDDLDNEIDGLYSALKSEVETQTSSSEINAILQEKGKNWIKRISDLLDLEPVGGFWYS